MKKRQRKRRIQGRRFARAFVSTALALLLAGSGIPAASVAEAADSTTLQNPRVSDVQGGEQDAASGLRNPRVKMRVRDTITFGSYWQEDTNGDGVADEKDDKQPISWQVLSVDGNDVFLLADKVLDCQPYNTEYTSVTWETCSLRKWLNEDFCQAAFSEAEQAAIAETAVINEDNPEYETEGGADTKDKVILLSLSEVADPTYGFHSDRSYCDQARIGKATSYAEAKDIEINGEKGCYWWLRSPGSNGNIATDIRSDGYVNLHGRYVHDSDYGVRPAVHLNLFSFSLQKANIVETAMEESEWDVVELGTWRGQSLYWRVLFVKEEDVYLLADRILTDKVYHETDESAIWEKSTLRSWLNGDFYGNAFSDNEVKGIWDVAWENPDNPWYDTEGGGDTMDLVALLSLPDTVKKEYGFPVSHECKSVMREAVDGKKESGSWWLRSPGYYDYLAAYVSNNGYVNSYGVNVLDVSNSSVTGVRPALHFDLSSSSLKKVGTVTAKEDSAAGGSDSGVTYDPPGLYTEFSADPEQPSKPSDPSGGGSAGTPSGGSPSGTPSGSQGQIGTGSAGNGGASGGSAAQGGTGSQNGTQADQKEGSGGAAKPGKVSSLKAKNNKKKTVTLSWKKVRGAKKYQIQYSRNKKFKKAKTKTVKKVNCKVTRLAKGKTFYFRVRAISAGGKKGTWSRTVKVKIKK